MGGVLGVEEVLFVAREVFLVVVEVVGGVVGTALDVVGNVSNVFRKVLAVVLSVVTLTLGVVGDVVEEVATASGTKVVLFDDLVLCSISDTVLVLLMEWWRWLFFNFP